MPIAAALVISVARATPARDIPPMERPVTPPRAAVGTVDFGVVATRDGDVVVRAVVADLADDGNCDWAAPARDMFSAVALRVDVALALGRPATFGADDDIDAGRVDDGRTSDWFWVREVVFIILESLRVATLCAASAAHKKHTEQKAIKTFLISLGTNSTKN